MEIHPDQFHSHVYQLTENVYIYIIVDRDVLLARPVVAPDVRSDPVHDPAWRLRLHDHRRRRQQDPLVCIKHRAAPIIK